MQGFHLLPDLLPVVSLIRASLKTAKRDNCLAADFYPPATDGCSRAKCLYRTSHTDGIGTAQSFCSELLSCAPPFV